MALATSNEAAALLLAYCVAGLSLWTIEDGLVARKPAGSFSARSDIRNELPVPLSKNYFNEAIFRPVQAPLERWQRAIERNIIPVDNASGEGKETGELRRRAVTALILISLLESSSLKREQR